MDNLEKERKLLEWLKDEPDFNINQEDIEEILRDYEIYLNWDNRKSIKK